MELFTRMVKVLIWLVPTMLLDYTLVCATTIRAFGELKHHFNIYEAGQSLLN